MKTSKIQHMYSVFYINQICRFLAVLLLFIFSSNIALAEKRNSGYPVPRYLSIKKNKVRGRYGPGKKYPEKYLFKNKNMPVRVENEYYGWYYIVDYTGARAWIHKSQLSGKRYGIVKSSRCSLFRKENSGSKVVAKFGEGNILELKKCKVFSKFCKIKIDDWKGYVKKDKIFGILGGENI